MPARCVAIDFAPREEASLPDRISSGEVSGVAAAPRTVILLLYRRPNVTMTCTLRRRAGRGSTDASRTTLVQPVEVVAVGNSMHSSGERGGGGRSVASGNFSTKAFNPSFLCASTAAVTPLMSSKENGGEAAVAAAPPPAASASPAAAAAAAAALLQSVCEF